VLTALNVVLAEDAKSYGPPPELRFRRETLSTPRTPLPYGNSDLPSQPLFLGRSVKVNQRSDNHRFGVDVRVGGVPRAMVHPPHTVEVEGFLASNLEGYVANQRSENHRFGVGRDFFPEKVDL